jgi:hypothetical protein
VFFAIEDGCKPTYRAVTEQFRWGSTRARRALKQLRAVGLLEASAEDEGADTDEEENNNTDVTVTRVFHNSRLGELAR